MTHFVGNNVTSYQKPPEKQKLPSFMTLEKMAELKKDPRLPMLVAMHSYMRPRSSAAEKVFIKKYIDCVEGIQSDAYGNRYVTIPHPDGRVPKVAWMCHTDTVHRKSGQQKLLLKDGILTVNKAKTPSANCLGADDTAGIFVCLEMIRQNTPGLYIFHRDEECGGHGSAYIADHHPELVKDIQFAISLDRKGYTSIITRQSFDCVCSDAFVKSLADQMPDMDMKKDTGGSFTDSANYAFLVPEITNLSVGYFNQHTHTESLDCLFVIYLADVLAKVDQDKLVCGRETGPEVHPFGGGGGGYTTYYGSGYGNVTSTDRGGRGVKRKQSHTRRAKRTITNDIPWGDDEDVEAFNWNDETEAGFLRLLVMEEIVKNHTIAVAKILSDYGLTSFDLEDAVYDALVDLRDHYNNL